MTGDDALAWQERAHCARPGTDPRHFNATSYPEAYKALAICHGCPVTDLCAASRPRDVGGVWGGRVWADGGRVVNPSLRFRRTCPLCHRQVSQRGRDDCRGPGSLCHEKKNEYYRLREQAKRGAA